MKIRATVTVEVDPAKWMQVANCDRGEVRADVLNYIRSLQDAAMFSEAEAKVAVRGLR